MAVKRHLHCFVDVQFVHLPGLASALNARTCVVIHLGPKLSGPLRVWGREDALEIGGRLHAHSSSFDQRRERSVVQIVNLDHFLHKTGVYAVRTSDNPMAC
jgi:hypothetical protein